MSTAPHLSDELLSGHLDGALDAAREGIATAHLAECDDCSRKLEQMRAVSRAVAGLPLETPPRDLDLGFLRETLPTGVRRSEPTGGWMPRVLRGWPASFAAGGLAAAAVFAIAILLTPQVMNAFRSPSLAQRNTSGSVGVSGTPAVPNVATTLAPGADSVVNGAAPAAGSAGRTSQLTQSQSAKLSNGLQLTLATPARVVRNGDQVDVVFRITGGDTDQDLSPYYIGVAISRTAGAGGTTLVTSSGDSLVVKAHHTEELDYQWTVPAGAGGPGGYYLVATVNSTVSGTVSIPITIS